MAISINSRDLSGDFCRAVTLHTMQDIRDKGEFDIKCMRCSLRLNCLTGEQRFCTLICYNCEHFNDTSFRGTTGKCLKRRADVKSDQHACFKGFRWK